MGKNTRRDALMEAADLGLLYYGQVKPLVDYLEQRERKQRASQFNATTVLTYLGALLAVAACGLFTVIALEKWGSVVLLDLTLLYIAICYFAASAFHRQQMMVPAGLFAGLLCGLIPVASFAILNAMNYWPDGANAQNARNLATWFDWRWLMIELSAFVASCWMLRRFKVSFLVLPVALSLLVMALDMIPAYMQPQDWALVNTEGWALRKNIALVCGFISMVSAFLLDLRTDKKADYVFWLYLFGLIIFCAALSSFDTNNIAAKIVYLTVNVLLVLLSAALQRRSFALFGGVGMALALGDLAWNIFNDSFAFVAILTLIALFFIVAGLWWSKHEQSVASFLRSFLPETMQNDLIWRN
jgi:hypothetical protein